MKKKSILKVSTGWLILFGMAISQSSFSTVETLKNGSWKDTLSWSNNSIPGEMGTTQINHRVFISGSVKTGNIVVSPGSELYFSNAEGAVSLICGSITVMPGGKVTAENTLTGLVLDCGAIHVQKDSVATGTFSVNYSGLSMTCGSIQNEGILQLLTSNYLSVNGDILNNGHFTYSGNGIQLYGHRMIQENPAALWEVSQINYQMNWSQPQYLGTDAIPLSIGGMIQMKGTRFYSYGSRLRPLTKSAGISFDGGYFSGVNVDSLIIKGKNRFYIGSSNLTDCTTEDTIECASMTLWGKSTMNGVIQPKEYGSPYGSSVALLISGDATLNGTIRDTTDQFLTVSYCGSFTNNGHVLGSSIYGFSCPRFVNNNTIIGGGISISKEAIFQYELNKRFDGLPIFENNGLIECNVGFDTTYTVLSRNAGTWTGALYSGLQNGFRSTLKGSHQITLGSLQHFRSGKEDVITMSRSQLIDFKGNETKVFMKSGCSISGVDSCDMVAYSALEILGSNSGRLLAKDTLTYSQVSFKGELTTNSVVKAKEYNRSLTSAGVWINNGKVLFQDKEEGLVIEGTFINNGTVNVRTSINGINGRIFQNGSWTSEKQIAYYLKDKANCMFWMIKPTTIGSPMYMDPQGGYSYGNKHFKNNNPIATLFHLTVAVADTGMYQVYANAPDTYSASNYITYRNPFGFTSPLAGDSIVGETITYRWNKIPGATGYKIRLISRNNGNDYSFGVDSVLNGDTTMVFNQLGENTYYAKFSVQFGYEDNYTWSEESISYPLIVRSDYYTAITKNSDSKPEIILISNPVNGSAEISLKVQKSGQAIIQICDLTGKTVLLFNEDVVVGKNTLRLDYHNLSGVYLLKINAPGATYVEKIVIK